MGQNKRDRTAQWQQERIRRAGEDGFRATMELIRRKEKKNG